MVRLPYSNPDKFSTEYVRNQWTGNNKYGMKNKGNAAVIQKDADS